MVSEPKPSLPSAACHPAFIPQINSSKFLPSSPVKQCLQPNPSLLRRSETLLWYPSSPVKKRLQPNPSLLRRSASHSGVQKRGRFLVFLLSAVHPVSTSSPNFQLSLLQSGHDTNFPASVFLLSSLKLFHQFLHCSQISSSGVPSLLPKALPPVSPSPKSPLPVTLNLPYSNPPKCSSTLSPCLPPKLHLSIGSCCV